MTLPTFITIGAEKCGTTALHTNLSKHPQVFMSTPKEPSFFLSTDPRYISQDMGSLKHEYIKTLSNYEDIFAGVKSETAIGESSPCYLYSEIAPFEIKALLPDIKIIAILRNPMERAYSQFVFNQQRGWESRKITFKKALELEDERFSKNSMWAFHYKRRGMYYSQIQLYQKVFGVNQVQVILYDDYIKDPDSVLAKIYTFLEIDNFSIENIRERHNVTGVPKNEMLNKLTDSPNLLKSFVKLVLPQTARSKILAAIHSLNISKPPVNPNDLIELKQVFKPDIQNLAEIILSDPLHWLDKSH